MEWEDRPAVKKGTFGEDIVDQFLMDRGWIPYAPIAKGAHPFDRLNAHRDKKRVMVVEVKAKTHRSAYPDTGVNLNQWKTYDGIRQEYGLPVFLAFVDDIEQKIYGNFLDELEKPETVDGHQYPWVHYGIRYWPWKSMLKIADLTEDQCAELKRLSNRNPSYGVPPCN